MKNRFDIALTVDVEDWFHLCHLPSVPRVSVTDWRVLKNIETLLALLDTHGVSATFFVLGVVAEAFPELVPMIAERGHEIASHGFSHTVVSALTPQGFRDELQQTAALIEKQCGQRPYGYRAPQWSLSLEKTPWAFEILAEEGYRYDSSCSPLRFVGNPQGARVPFCINVAQGTLWEIPPMVSPSLLGNLPTGGGWGFRFFPFPLIEDSVNRLQQEGGMAVFYLHPRELDPAGPRLPLSPLKSFVSYGSRRDAAPRLVKLFENYRFCTLRQVVDTWGIA